MNDRIHTPIGTLTRRGETVLVAVLLLGLILALAVAGGVELGTL